MSEQQVDEGFVNIEELIGSEPDNHQGDIENTDSRELLGPDELLDQIVADEADASEDLAQADDPEAEEEEEAEEDTEDDVEEQEPAQEQPKKANRAQERIRELVNQRKEVEAQAAAERTQLVQQQQYMFQQMQQMQASYNQQLQAMQATAAKAQAVEEEAGLSEWEKERRKIIREADERAQTATQEALRPYQERLQQQQQQAEAQQKALAHQQTVSRLEVDATAAVDKFLEAYPVEAQKGLRESTIDRYLSHCLGEGVSPSEGLPSFKKWVQGLTSAEFEAKKQPKAEKLKKSRAMPKTASAGRAAAPGVGSKRMPTLTQLKQKGFDDHLAWINAGEPSIS